MQFVICGPSNSCAYLQSLGSGISWIRVESVSDAADQAADAFFCMDEAMVHADFGFTNQPVFVNAVKTLKVNFATPRANVYRFNGWSSFLVNEVWEIVGSSSIELDRIANALNKQFGFVPDLLGFVAPRIIVNIINEAYFALEEGIASAQDIDTAMKQGTSYPYGPFEWAQKLGKAEVLALLELLSATQNYLPVSRLLMEEVKSKK